MSSVSSSISLSDVVDHCPLSVLGILIIRTTLATCKRPSRWGLLRFPHRRKVRGGSLGPHLRFKLPPPAPPTQLYAMQP